MTKGRIMRVAIVALILINTLTVILAVKAYGFTNATTSATLLTCLVIGLGVKGITVNKYIVLDGDTKDTKAGGGDVNKDIKDRRISAVLLATVLILTLINVALYVKASTPALDIVQDVVQDVVQDQVQEQTVTVNINTKDDINALDLNTATREELEALPGVGKVLAGRIIDRRPFYSVEEIKRVNGIGDVLFMKIRGLVKVG